MHAHACDGADGPDDSLLASCGADGTVCIWSLGGDNPRMLRQWPKMEAVCVQLDPSRLICAGEGTRPIEMYDWRDASPVQTFADDDPPLGVTCALHRSGHALAAGNTFSKSQLRVWDVPSGALVDRFSLPAACRGVRCVQLVPEEHALIAGCANGWVVWCDLRCGRYEKKMQHTECVNSVHLRRGKLITTADDGVVRITDPRTFSAVGSHRMKRVVFSACCDDERLFAGCDDGTVHVFDYSSSAATTLNKRGQGGGFSMQQTAALSAAVEAARRRADAGVAAGPRSGRSFAAGYDG